MDGQAESRLRLRGDRAVEALNNFSISSMKAPLLATEHRAAAASLSSR
jgi:hypothetical protein